MEEHEGDDVAVGQRRRILAVEHKLLHRIGPPTEKTVLDEDLHVCIGNIRAIPRIHGGWRCLRRSKGGGRGAEATDLLLQRWISKHGRSKWRRRRNKEGKVVVLVCRNTKGEAAIYRAEQDEKVNRPPRLMRPLCHVTSSPSEDCAHAISVRALKGHAG